jgi:hypothetical protein
VAMAVSPFDHRLYMLCSESADGKFSSTSKMVTDQIAMLNSAYASARFRFTLANVFKHVNKNWCVVTCSAVGCNMAVAA